MSRHTETSEIVHETKLCEMNFALPLKGKPRLILRRHWGLAALLSAAGLIYGSLLPFRFRDLTVSQGWQEFVQLWTAGSKGYSSQDVAVNVLIAVPLAFALMGSLLLYRRRKVARIAGTLAAISVSVSVSVAVEFGQLWIDTRVSSPRDVAAQAVGAAIGCVLWLACGPRFSAKLDEFLAGREPASRVVWLLNAWVVVVVVWSLLPFDLVTSLGEIARKYQRGQIEIVPFTYVFPSRLKFWYGALAQTALFVPVGVWSMLAWAPRAEGGRRRAGSVSDRRSEVGDQRSEIRGRRSEIGDAQRSTLNSSNPWTALAVCLSANVAIEFAQLLVKSRYTSSQDVLWGTLGCAVGIWCAVALLDGRRGIASGSGSHTRRPSSRGTQPLRAAGFWFVVAFAYVLVLLAIAWAPFEFTRDAAVIQQRLHALAELPFRALQADGSDAGAMFHIIRNVAWYVPLGVLAALVVFPLRRLPISRRALAPGSDGHESRTEPGASALRLMGRFSIAAVAVAGVCIVSVLGQVLLPGRPADLTDGLLRFAGGVAGLALATVVLSRWSPRDQ